ncbi:DUF305 domain-containing protein [Streptomyces sp. SID486]|uniref:DUF305 domain-containing protein n=1 Tax=Streptomyces sp. SID486 TaxID=2690264 RepID=UPI00136E32AF|nr:DUF305 domain-containing protein [Streptomyces sp. SID486]MYX95757.1 DUF305 domain-containing protein [Streptomyces sp. SID486]
MTSRTLTRRAALAAAAVTTALVLSSCSGGGDSHGGGHPGHGSSATAAAPDRSASPHNAQDVAFAQGMIPHHRQALEMAELAADRASSARVKDLAARIEKAQDPEIRTMTGWLKAWGEKTPAPGTDHTGHTGMSGMAGMSGMMSDADMDALRKADGKDFDTRFLALMVRHHQGAVEMAATEKDKGRSGTAKDMADAVVTAQSAEIKEMRQLLGTS